MKHLFSQALLAALISLVVVGLFSLFFECKLKNILSQVRHNFIPDHGEDVLLYTKPTSRAE